MDYSRIGLVSCGDMPRLALHVRLQNCNLTQGPNFGPRSKKTIAIVYQSIIIKLHHHHPSLLVLTNHSSNVYVALYNIVIQFNSIQ